MRNKTQFSKDRRRPFIVDSSLQNYTRCTSSSAHLQMLFPSPSTVRLHLRSWYFSTASATLPPPAAYYSVLSGSFPAADPGFIDEKGRRSVWRRPSTGAGPRGSPLIGPFSLFLRAHREAKSHQDVYGGVHRTHAIAPRRSLCRLA